MKFERLTPDEISAILDYHPESGWLTWRVRRPDSFYGGEGYRQRDADRWNRKMSGRRAGHLAATGYRVVCIARRTYQAHRLAWAIQTGSWPADQIDHINHDRDDNRWVNLRDATGSENCRNRSRPASNTSGAIGVHFHRPSKKWHARVFHDGKRIHLGAFDSHEAAASARRAVNSDLGFHPNHGGPKQ